MANVMKEFKSIGEFVEYLKSTNTPGVVGNFGASMQSDWHNWSMTKSFDEAVNLITNGWSEVAEKMENIMLKNKDFGTKTTIKSKYDVVGGNASVPRYIQGIPTNMINQTRVVQKQKVITIVKHVGYRADITSEQIMESSIRALQIVKQIEAQGVRVNLDVISPASPGGFGSNILTIRVRIKKASEKLNISKVAFPMVHPSMLRRLVFRAREMDKDVSSNWRGTVGGSIYDKDIIKGLLKKDDYYLHNFIGSVDEEIKNMKIF